MLKLNQVHFQYEVEDFDIVDGLDLHVPAGSFVTMLGRSGCGKSTIFRMVAGLLQAKSGEILVEGKPITNRKGYCGYMPQKDLLFPWRTVAQNLRLPLELQGGHSKKEMDRQVEEALTQVGLSGWGQKYPDALSGGMRQRAAFARTTLTGGSLLLLDEPFSALDALTRIEMQEWLLSRWEEERPTILFITHDVEEALYLSQTIYLADVTPIQRLTRVEVPGDYPRSRAHLTEPHIVALREELIATLRGGSQG